MRIYPSEEGRRDEILLLADHHIRSRGSQRLRIAHVIAPLVEDGPHPMALQCGDNHHQLLLRDERCTMRIYPSEEGRRGERGLAGDHVPRG